MRIKVRRKINYFYYFFYFSCNCSYLFYAIKYRVLNSVYSRFFDFLEGIFGKGFLITRDQDFEEHWERSESDCSKTREPKLLKFLGFDTSNSENIR